MFNVQFNCGLEAHQQAKNSFEYTPNKGMCQDSTIQLVHRYYRRQGYRGRQDFRSLGSALGQKRIREADVVIQGTVLVLLYPNNKRLIRARERARVGNENDART